MRINKLYIGSIRKITEVKKVEPDSNFIGDKIYVAETTRKTIFLKSHDDSKTVKDVIYGGKYRIGNGKANRVGKKYAADLNQYYLIKKILKSGYKGKHIGIIKLTKIMTKDQTNWR